MAYTKYKNQSDLSFLMWINGSPQSNHPNDMNRFYVFIKTICRYNSKRWKDSKYFKEMVLNHIPSFDKKRLNNLIDLHEVLIDFNHANPIPYGSLISNPQNLKNGQYFGKGVKDGKIYNVIKKQII